VARAIAQAKLMETTTIVIGAVNTDFSNVKVQITTLKPMQSKNCPIQNRKSKIEN